MSSEHYYCHFNCTETDLGLRSRTFSLKINTFAEITQTWQGIKTVFMRLDKFTY